MTTSIQSDIATLGFLRLGLIGLAIVSMLFPIVEWIITLTLGELAESSLLALIAGMIAPVMAPMLIVVILLDVIMARVHVEDDDSETGDRYRAIGRVGTVLIIVMLAFWVPFFINLVN